MTKHDELREQTRRHLNQSLEDLEPEVTQRLADARRHALQASDTPEYRTSRNTWPAWGLAASVAVAAVLGVFYSGTDEPHRDGDPFDVVMTGEPLELYADLEFYLWLEEQDVDELAQQEPG